MNMSNKIRLQSRGRTDIRQTLGVVDELVDPEFGVIQSIYFYPLRHDDPQFVHCHATMPDLSRVTGRYSNRGTGSTALTKDVALVKAVGESVERYCGDVRDQQDVIYAPYKKVRGDAVDPRRFVMFHPKQYQSPNFPFPEVTEESMLGWVQGYSVTHRRPVLVPALQAHVGYSPVEGEWFEMSPVSGYACGNTYEEAILNAVCEVVERDAFMVFWYNYLPVPAFDLSAMRSEAARQTLDRYSGTPVKLHCANITSDIGIPAALAMMTSTAPGWPAAVVAAAADLDAERAITRALQELSANHLYIRSYWENPSHPLPQTPAQVAQMEDHGLFYCQPQNLGALDALLRPRENVRPEDVGGETSDDVLVNIERCVERLSALDLEVLAVDLTTPDVESLGLKVVKVLIPGAQPIDFGMHWRHFGGRRIYEAPQRMGYRDRDTLPSEINLFPHPFP
jgi:ribosomal protein S12 methylthiotransferase accessory factor